MFALNLRSALYLSLLTAVLSTTLGCQAARFGLEKPKKEQPQPKEILPEPPKVEAPVPEETPDSPERSTQEDVPPVTTEPPQAEPPFADDFVVNIPKSGYVNQCLDFVASCGVNGLGKITFFFGDRYFLQGNHVKFTFRREGRYQVTARCDEVGKGPRFKSQMVDIYCYNR